MTPYLFALFFVTASTAVAYKAKKANYRHIAIALSLSAMIALAGLRDISVGTDTINYISLFHNNYSLYELNDLPYEYGFSIFIWMLRQFTDSNAIYLTSIAAVAATCFAISISKNSEKYHVAFFLLLAAGYFTYSFNTARQGIALAIFSLAVKSLLERRFWRYAIVVTIAGMFHASAFITLPAYYFVQVRQGWRQWMILFLFLVLFFLFGEAVLRYVYSLSDKYDAYRNSDITGGYIGFATSVVILLIFAILSNKIYQSRADYLKLMSFYALGIIASLGLIFYSQHPSGPLRVGIYFSFVQIFMWPIVFANLRKNLTGHVVGVGFFIFFTIYFYLTTSTFGDLVPYVFS